MMPKYPIIVPGHGAQHFESGADPLYLTGGNTPNTTQCWENFAGGRQAAYNSVGLVSASGTGSLYLVYFTLPLDLAVSKIGFMTGTAVAAPTPSLAKVALFSADGSNNVSRLAASTSDTTMFQYTSNYVKKSITPQSLTHGVRYAAAILGVGSNTTNPTIRGNSGGVSNPNASQVNIWEEPPIMARTVGLQTDIGSSYTYAATSSSNVYFYVALFA